MSPETGVAVPGGEMVRSGELGLASSDKGDGIVEA